MATKVNLVAELGTARLIVDFDKFTLRVVRELTTAVSQIRDKHLEAVDAKLQKNDNESDEDYNKRIAGLGDENLLTAIAFDLLVKIGELFNQSEKVTKENFEDSSWPKVKMFLFNMLSEGDISFAVAFQPTRRAE